MSVKLTDGSIHLKEITFGWFEGVHEKLTMKATHGGGVVVRVGDKEALVSPQDLLNAARLFGAKDIDARIK